MTNHRPVIFGEVLFDVFENGDAVLGGAPFNVAWHLHGFGAEPVFVSRIGSDDLGKQVLDIMRKWGMDTSAVQSDPQHATGKVSVKIKDGQPSFQILEGVAYDHIDSAEVRKALNQSPAMLYHGSLITRHATSRNTLLELRSNLNAPLFVDINLRAPWDKTDFSEPLLTGVNWLKLNEDELQIFTRYPLNTRQDAEQAAREMLGRYGLEFMVVTMGSEGAFLVRDETTIHSPPVPTKTLVDTVGAGDALSSVLLFGILNAWDLDVCLKRAVEFASAICEQRGATSFNRDLYSGFLKAWKV